MTTQPPRNPPRITIVTPSYNQGAWIAETIESVLAQGYPNVEHIVVDAVSKDGTAEVLARYPHLTVICEPDRGQADAINKGFARATGQILAFLNADDTLLPGTLARVAAEIDPARGRHVVMGRCRFIDADGRPTGIEHPSAFESHERVLAIWKGYTIPQPAVFWTREAWERCGPLDAEEQLVLDYDLFCRMSRHYDFHVVDQLFCTYRLQEDSKTMRSDRGQRLNESIRVSRRYWGPIWSPMHLRLAASLALHRLNRVRHGRERMRRAMLRRQHGDIAGAVWNGLMGALLAPGVAFYVVAYPALHRRAVRLARGLLARFADHRPATPHENAHGRNEAVWSDGWAGPCVVLELRPDGSGAPLRLLGHADLTYIAGPLTLQIAAAGMPMIERRFAESGAFAIELPLAASAGAPVRVVVRADRSFVNHRFRANEDHRPLSWRLSGVEGGSLVAGAPAEVVS